jgi:uncharacterized protein with HEPN domain
MRTESQRILDILDAIANAQRYAVLGRARFDADELVRTYITHQLFIIGEASYQLPASLKDEHPEIPWHKVVGMRHVLVHGYFATNDDILWQVVESDLPPLKAQLERALTEL